MKCPQCGFVSSNKRDLCPKCALDLRSHKRSLGLPVSYPSLTLDELRAKEAGTQATSARTPSTASSTPAPQPVAQASAPKMPVPEAKKTSFLDRVLGNKTKTDNQAAPSAASTQSGPNPSVPTQSAPRQPAAKAPLGETKPANDKSTPQVKSAPVAHSVDPLPAVELGELEADLEVMTGDSTSLHVTQAVGASESHPLSDQSKSSDQLKDVDFSDPIEFEKLIEQLETAGQDFETELLPPVAESGGSTPTEDSDEFSLGAIDTASKHEDIWGNDELEQDELPLDPQNSGPLVAPEVLEFFDDEALLEKQLDAMLEDTQLNITAVKLERPPEPSKQTLAASEAADDELEFSFEFEPEEESETEDVVEAAGRSAEAADELADIGDEDATGNVSEDGDDFELPTIDTALSQETLVASTLSGEAVVSDLSALPFVDLSALLDAELTAELTAEPTTETEPIYEEQPEAKEAESLPEPEHPAVEQALELHDLISAIAQHYGVSEIDVRARLADLEQEELTPPSAPKVDEQLQVVAVEEAPSVELTNQTEEPPPHGEPEAEVDVSIALAPEEIPQLVSAPPEVDSSDQKKNFAEDALATDTPDTVSATTSVLSDFVPSAVVTPDISIDLPPNTPKDIPGALWQNVEQELLSYIADEVEINSGDLVRREANGTLDMYFALVDEELVSPAKHRSLSEKIKPVEVKIDTQALKTALSTYTKKAQIVEQQVREAAENRAPQNGPFTIPSHLKPIPLWRRGIAAAIDCSICSLVGALLCGVMFVPDEIRRSLQSTLLSGSLPDLYLLLTVLPSFIGTTVLAWIVLTTAAIAGKSQTYGQQFIGASVTDLRGDPISLADSLLWTLCQITTLLSCGLGLLPALGTSGRTLHDRLAGVLVARFDMEEFFSAAQSSAPASATDEILDFRS